VPPRKPERAPPPPPWTTTSLRTPFAFRATLSAALEHGQPCPSRWPHELSEGVPRNGGAGVLAQLGKRGTFDQRVVKSRPALIGCPSAATTKRTRLPTLAGTRASAGQGNGSSLSGPKSRHPTTGWAEDQRLGSIIEPFGLRSMAGISQRREPLDLGRGVCAFRALAILCYKIHVKRVNSAICWIDLLIYAA
jgi:hypothetical protein